MLKLTLLTSLIPDTLLYTLLACTISRHCDRICVAKTRDFDLEPRLRDADILQDSDVIRDSETPKLRKIVVEAIGTGDRRRRSAIGDRDGMVMLTELLTDLTDLTYRCHFEAWGTTIGTPARI